MRGIDYLNNRYHDPSLGSFISVDPLVVQTGEPYIYGSANPIVLSDPSGLCSTSYIVELGCAGTHRLTSGSGSGDVGQPAVVPRTHFGPQPGLGVVRTNLFIADRQVGEPFATSDGNARGFSSAAGCDVSKVCLVVNFDEGWYEGQISPTCHNGVCTDAYPLGAGNTFDVSVFSSADGLVLDVRIDALNPRAPKVLGRAPAIDMHLRMGIETVSRPGSPSLRIDSFDQRVFFIEATGDGYPSIETYVTTASGTVAAIQDREGLHLPGLGPLPLWPPWPNRTARYERVL